MRLALFLIAVSCGGSSAEKTTAEPAPPPVAAEPPEPAPEPPPAAAEPAPAAESPPAKKKVPDAIEAGPDVYKVLIETPSVRVLEATYQPGTKVPMHKHPDHVVYALSG